MDDKQMFCMYFRELEKTNKNTPSVIIHWNKERLNKEFSMTCILVIWKDDHESTKMISQIPSGPVLVVDLAVQG